MAGRPAGRMRALGAAFALGISMVGAGTPAAWGQGPAQAPGAAPATSQASSAALPQVGSAASGLPAPSAGQKPAADPAAGKPASPKKKGKEAYNGPTEVVLLPPTPMLDDDGKQRLDPDGKPMFHPPVAQQRDKHGHPLFDDKGKPIFQTATELGYDEKGHKLKAKKEKEPRKTPVSIERGTFTVDGVIGKAALNYDIADLKYVYLYVPGEGVVVVSNTPFDGAREQKEAFRENSLKVSVDGHELELSSDKRLLGKKPESAFVLVDRDFKLPSKFPVVGYGTLRKPPYAWPGSKLNEALTGPVQPPAIPENLMPALAKLKCPAGKVPTISPKQEAVCAVPGRAAPVTGLAILPATAAKSPATPAAGAPAAGSPATATPAATPAAAATKPATPML